MYLRVVYTRLRSMIAVAAFTFCWPAVAAAQSDPPPPPKVRVYYRDVLAARVNPLGLINDFRVSVRRRILEPGGALTKETFVGVGTSLVLSPAFFRYGPFVEVQPLSILTLAAGVEAQGYFRTFSQLQSFPTATAAYDDETLSKNAERDEHYATTATVAFLEARLQFKVGPVAARSAMRALHTAVTATEGDVAYYDQILDILVPRDGWLVTNDADVLVLPNQNWIFGVRHTFTHSFLPEPATANETHRLGPLIGYRFFDTPYAMFNQPTLNLLAQWWLVHPYRTGAKQPTALPLIALAFSFNGDFL
ncbi:MAG: hypothetical protein IPK82_41990 [Polyangiaceae bacterium]|nr:hypothetical protein [Polyangiaceae bacterium]